MKYKKSKILDIHGNSIMMPIKERNYSAGDYDSLTQDWLMPNTSGDAELRQNLSKVRRRARETERNNPYYENSLNLQEINQIGPRGLRLQMRLKSSPELLDRELNSRIEEAFGIWCQKENCSIDGLRSWIDIQRLVVRSKERDGEILILKYKGREFGAFGYQLKILEGDHLDENYFDQLQNGNYIIMGIEYSPLGKPVAYHIFANHPGDYWGFQGQNSDRIRIPADRIVHIFNVSRRASQHRGITEGVSVLKTLHHQEGGEEATIVAYRSAACQSGFLERELDAVGDVVGDSKDSETGESFFDLTPGIYRKLPAGIRFVPHSPNFPPTQYPPFAKHMLRKASAGLGVPYHSLSWDLEGVNYSSIRAGTIDFRDMCAMEHQFLADHFCEEIFKDWPEMAILSGQLDLPFAKIEEILKPANHYWQARGWDWVDPSADVDADIRAKDAGLKSASEIISKRGGNLEDIWAEIASEKDLRKQLGLAFGSQLSINSASKKSSKEKDEDLDLQDEDGQQQEEQKNMNHELEQLRSMQMLELKERLDTSILTSMEANSRLSEISKKMRSLEESLGLLGEKLLAHIEEMMDIHFKKMKSATKKSLYSLEEEDENKENPPESEEEDEEEE
jgi:lambda family phage portal protein